MRIFFAMFVALFFCSASVQGQYEDGTTFKTGICDITIKRATVQAYNDDLEIWPNLYVMAGTCEGIEVIFEFSKAISLDVYMKEAFGMPTKLIYSSGEMLVNNYNYSTWRSPWETFESGNVFLFLANDSDTLMELELNVYKADSFEELSLQSSAGQVKLRGNYIYICDEDFYNESWRDLHFYLFYSRSVYDSYLNEWNMVKQACGDEIGGSYYLGYGGADLTFYKNGKSVSHWEFVRPKDGDTIWLEKRSNFMDYSGFKRIKGNCDCIYDIENREVVSTPKYIVRMSSLGHEDQTESKTICPGDTVQVAFPIPADYYNAKYQPKGDSKWYSVDKNYKITRPGVLVADYERADEGCKTYTYTLSVNQDDDCLGLVSGTVYHDANGNGIRNGSSEPLLGQSLIQFSSDSFTYSNEGTYSMFLPAGNTYMVSALREGWSGASLEVDFSDPSAWNVVSDLAIPLRALRDKDLEVTVTATEAHPGEPITIHVDIRNHGTENVWTDVALELDQRIQELDQVVSQLPSGRNGLLAKIGIPVRQTFRITVKGQIDPLALRGDELVVKANVVYGEDENPENNTDTLFLKVGTGNEEASKRMLDEEGHEHNEVSGHPSVHYLIRFSNTGEGPVQSVTIVDTLSSDLDLSTFRMVAASHGYHLQIIEGRILRWTFNNINLSGAEGDEFRRSGFVRFAISPKVGISELIPITNQAHVYYGGDQPYTTNITVLGAEDLVTDILSDQFMHTVPWCYPNPAKDELTIRLPVEGKLQVYDNKGILLLEEAFTGNKKLRTDAFPDTDMVLIRVEGNGVSVQEKIRLIK